MAPNQRLPDGNPYLGTLRLCDCGWHANIYWTAEDAVIAYVACAVCGTTTALYAHDDAAKAAWNGKVGVVNHRGATT